MEAGHSETEHSTLDDALRAREQDSRPARFVRGHRAVAYCKWLNAELSHSAVFAASPIAQLVREQGWRVTLPSELEWEKAARGGLRDKVFSWGDDADPERANYDDTGIGDTSVVGCFPANAYGLHDMIGNVWEWTRSKRADYAYDSNDPAREDLTPDETEWLVRGGSWINHRYSARCAFRLAHHPDFRLITLGFRVVLSAAPVPDSEL